MAMTYKHVFDSVKASIGLPDADDGRLLAELNLLRDDMASRTDWFFLRRRRTATAYSSGSIFSLVSSSPVIGVVAVLGEDGQRVYYHAPQGALPRNTGLRFWAWSVAADSDSPPGRHMLFYDEAGEAVVLDDSPVDVFFWVRPEPLVSGQLVSVNMEFPYAKPLYTGLHLRWRRYQELRGDESTVMLDQQYVRELESMVAANPAHISIPAFSRGGFVFSASDRLIDAAA